MKRWLFGLFCLLALARVADAATATPPVAFGDLNATFGIPLWADDNLWDDTATSVASRLHWPRESLTSHDSSFRLYTQPDFTVLGEHPFSVVLYGNAEGNADHISMTFANLGDVQDLPNGDGNLKNTNLQRQLAAEVGQLILREGKSMAAKLTALLGKPRLTMTGDPQTGESILRWNWGSHAIELATSEGKYLALRILPTDAADHKKIQYTTDAAMRKQLSARVTRRPNGDVIIGDIPMVNQGPKGYCVPATWERDLRYMGLPADMYTLAVSGASQVGGGTNADRMMGAVTSLVRDYDHHLVSQNGPIQIPKLAEKIDQGIPLMWTLWVVKTLNSDLTTRAKARTTITDWAAYTKSLDPARHAAANIATNFAEGHMCMIIGYNPKTQELAISDSWGPQFAERWITVEEAQAISQGGFYEVTW